MVSAQPPRQMLETFLGVLSKTVPALSWLDPKAMSEMTFNLISANALYSKYMGFKRPYWLGAFTTALGKVGYFGVIPVRGKKGGKRLMEHFFSRGGEDNGTRFHVMESGEKVWWTQKKGFLLACSTPGFLKELRETVFPRLQSHPPQSALVARVWPKRIQRRWGFKLKEFVSMLAVFGRFGFLSARVRADETLLLRIGVALRALLDRWLTRWAGLADHVKSLGLRLSLGEDAVQFEGEVSPVPGSPLSRILTGSRSGRPVGLDLLDGDPFFFYSHRLGWGGVGEWVESLTDAGGYLLEGAVESKKQRKHLQKRLRDFFSLSFGDLTVAIHALSLKEGKGKSHLLGAAAVGRVRDAKRLRRALLDLVETIKNLSLNDVFTRRDLEALRSCVQVTSGSQQIQGEELDWVTVDYDGVKCPGPLPLALTFVFGQPSIEMAFAARRSTVLWTCGPKAKTRLAAMAKRKGNKKSSDAGTSRMAEELSKSRASGWVFFSPATFIRETNLFGVSGSGKWVHAAKGLEGPGGVGLSWGTRKSQKGSEREAFVCFRVDNRELGRLFKVLLRTNRGVLGALMRSGTKK